MILNDNIIDSRSIKYYEQLKDKITYLYGHTVSTKFLHYKGSKNPFFLYCKQCKTLVKTNSSALSKRVRLKCKCSNHNFDFIKSKQPNNNVIAKSIYKDYDGKTIVCVQCNQQCNKKWDMSLSNFYKGAGCKECSNARRFLESSYDLSYVQNRINTTTKTKDYKVLDSSKGFNTKNDVLVKCLKCKCVSSKPLSYWFYDRYRCRNCYNSQVSLAEQQLQKYIRILYRKTILINNRDIIKPKELDIVLPESKLAIEYNGVYYHSDTHRPDDYQLNKTVEARRVGYSLFHIWEDQWCDKSKRKIIKSMLKAKLGLIKNKIYARKTAVKELDKTPTQFYNENHLQGSVASTYNYGLYYQEELVAVMSFSKSGELVRFCNRINLQVVGGFSKLLSYVIKLELFSEITSFSDNDYSDGTIYKNNGFTKVKELKQDYFYISKLRSNLFKRYHKFSMRKSKIAKKYGLDIKGKTERELTRELKLLRCYNSGKIKWSLISKINQNNGVKVLQ